MKATELTNRDLVASCEIAKKELAKQWSEAFKGWPEVASRPNWREEYPDQYDAANNAYLAAFEVTDSIREEFQSLCIEIESRMSGIPQRLTHGELLKHLEEA